MLDDSNDRVRGGRLSADLDALRTFLRRRGQGRRVFDASLGDVDQVPAFAAQLRAVAGAR